VPPVAGAAGLVAPPFTYSELHLKAVRSIAPRVPLPQHAAEPRSFSTGIFFKPRWVVLLFIPR
jgi:hypothetical protein